eukprot:TRINITY_DN5733_c0_g1_i2.p1 TRINITY_DN5733_c0_g1~~TRINITY_DN5733_c0_g1_i2.p1  ORF type:complete len:421 (-),score=75.90 TRINITY_DN5733_c0_g1_i2:84-1346(-)
MTAKLPFLIESGKVLGRNSDSDWKLSTGKGKRKWKKEIKFEKTFVSAPEVFLAFSLLDLVCDSDYRVCTMAKKITNKGFTLVIYTWRDSVVWSTAVTWLAYDADWGKAKGNIITSGKVDFGPKTKGYTLHEDEDDRSVNSSVKFSDAFKGNPVVLTGFSMLDILIDSDARVAVKPERVNSSGFDINLSTWNDSHVWGASVTWIAFNRDLSTDKGTGGRIQSGHHNFAKGNTGYQLHKGEGARELRYQMQYNKNFISKPDVVSFLSSIDIVVEQERDLRISVEALNSTVSGCELKAGTWHNSHIFSTTACYIAYGQTEYFDSQSSSQSSPPSSPPIKHAAKKQKISPDVAVVTKKDESEDSEKTEDDSCKVCFDNPINTCIIPCGHLSVCLDCSQAIMASTRKQCPICQVDIAQIVKIFKS